MDLLVNIDVPDLARAVAFYAQAFGLTVTRRFGAKAVELSGWPVLLYLLQQPEGSIGAGESARHYERHWTPVHIDFQVDDFEDFLEKAVKAGAKCEQKFEGGAHPPIAFCSDPFGNGFCVVGTTR